MPALLSSLVVVGCGAEDSQDAGDPGVFRGLDDGLELHWTFEDSVGSQIIDLSGNGRHGTLKAGAVLVASPEGQAVSLDGIDDYVSLIGPRSPALYGGADGSFTLSATVKIANISKYNTLCYGCGPFSTMYTGTETYGPVAMSAFDDQSSLGKTWALSEPALTNDTWTEVTVIVEDGASARYYVDCGLSGQLDDADIGLEDPGFSSVGFNSNPSRLFGGEIDELRVWNRVLDDTELAQLCPAPPTLEDGLELHWTFESRIGDQILDVSGHNHHGQNLGGSFVASATGEALYLDGLDDKVSFVGPRALALYGGEAGDLTLTARVKVADVAKYNTLCFGCGPFKAMYVGDPNVGGRVQSNLWNLDTQGNVWTTSSSALTNDEWVEVTLVVEGGVEARTYFDCALDSTLEGVNVGLFDPGYSAVGESSNPAWWFGGEIDELRIWSRALSDVEIASVCSRALCDGPIYVYVDAPAEGDGTSWATAFDNIQVALDAALECTDPQLWVAEGQYLSDPGEGVATITAPVAIYAGFSGVETELAQRDVVAHPVRLGGEGSTHNIVTIDDGATPSPDDEIRIDGVQIVGVDYNAIVLAGGNQSLGTVYLANLTITDITSTAVIVRSVAEIRDSSFERNYASRGAAIDVRYEGSATILNSSFVDNQASIQGGAIYVWDPVDVTISGSTFSGNQSDWGGAIFVKDIPGEPSYAELTVVDSEFTNNVSVYGGGAIYLEESTVNIDAVVFSGNTASYGGAIHLANGAADPDVVEIRNTRFIGNHAINGNGGALRLQEQGMTVINSEFVDNDASTVGGGVYGRGHFVSCTFAGNTANSGSGLYALAGSDMYMEHCVAYPDTIVGAGIHVPYSCMTNNVALLGAPKTMLDGVDPFDLADLDEDGKTEHYLLSDGPCGDLGGGVINEFDWTSLTVDISQCTDDVFPEPGVHYEPLSAVGGCELGG